MGQCYLLAERCRPSLNHLYIALCGPLENRKYHCPLNSIVHDLACNRMIRPIHYFSIGFHIYISVFAAMIFLNSFAMSSKNSEMQKVSLRLNHCGIWTFLDFLRICSFSHSSISQHVSSQPMSTLQSCCLLLYFI